MKYLPRTSGLLWL